METWYDTTNTNVRKKLWNQKYWEKNENLENYARTFEIIMLLSNNEGGTIGGTNIWFCTELHGASFGKTIKSQSLKFYILYQKYDSHDFCRW